MGRLRTGFADRAESRTVLPERRHGLRKPAAEAHRRDPQAQAGPVVGLDRDAATASPRPFAGSKRAPGVFWMKRRIGSSFSMPSTLS